jgi:hypothetical protein
MLNTLGFDKRDPPDYALVQAPIEAHFLKFGVSAGGMIRRAASSKPGTTVHGFDSFDGLPLARGPLCSNKLCHVEGSVHSFGSVFVA